MGQFSLKKEGRNVDATIEDGKLKRKTNLFGLAESMKRKDAAYRKNVSGTGEVEGKFLKGMANPKK